jgi:hypothetical protein
MSDYINLQNNAASLDYAPALEPFTGVRLWYDDEACYFAGDESGRVLEADCPWATQAMANLVLDSVRGFEYQPFEAGTALLDPGAELGDGVSVGGVYGPLASVSTVFDAMCASDISAPSEEEVNHEYPYLSPQEREMKRKVALGKSYYGTRITRQNGLEVIKTAVDGTETARVRLNSDELAFYDADGDEALYFDAAAGKYRFRGDVEITGGTMNVNDNFIVDEDGNLTINGNINLAGGSITWGGNYPGGEDPEAYLNSIGITYIDELQIQSPTITGNNIRALQAFSVGVFEGGEFNPRGHFGLGYGKRHGADDDDDPTYGVVMASSGTVNPAGVVTYDSDGRYVIVTDSGVRLQSFDNNIALTKSSIYLSIKDANDQYINWIRLDESGAFYNNAEIATVGDLDDIAVHRVEGTLQLFDPDGTSTGWVGSGRGQSNNGSITYGVAMASSTTAVLPDGSYSLDFDSEGRYVLVTTDGIKLKSGENTRITLTDNVISVRALNGTQFRYTNSEVVTIDRLKALGLIS